jgi:prepilin-type N-terminal cleavage/methylation domain-containing protein
MQYSIQLRKGRGRNVRVRSLGSSSRSGFSLVELTVVMVILTVAMAMFSSTVVSTARQGKVKRETAIAAEGARRMFETMRSEDFGDLFALYNDDPLDDPGGAGTAPGSSFDIFGLTPRSNDPDGLTGQIIFPSPGPQLREDGINTFLAMPRDLSGDGIVDGLDHSGDYSLIPIQVRVEWQGSSGTRRLDMFTAFTEI